jgi:alkylation response protein AidB-like acyl-CoA dehydrogenase
MGPRLEKIALKRERGEKGSGGAYGDDPMIMNIISKELSRVSPGTALSLGASLGLAGSALIGKGTARQIREHAVPIMLQEKIGSWCLTEPGAGSDAFGGMKTVARKKGDRFLLNGSKTFITNGPIADIFVVYARVEGGASPGAGSVNTFVVERGMKGVSTGKPFQKMGMKESPTSEVFFDDVELGVEDILGETEDRRGRLETKESLGSERSGIPSLCLGIIERCYEESVAYARTREQFGRPIGSFQAVQLKIADMYARYKNVENILYRLAWMQNNGVRDVSFINSSKVYASRAASQVASDAVQIFGGYGYVRDYPVEKMYRDAKLLEIGAGTNDINALTVARNELQML